MLILCNKLPRMLRTEGAPRECPLPAVTLTPESNSNSSSTAPAGPREPRPSAPLLPRRPAPPSTL